MSTQDRLTLKANLLIDNKPLGLDLTNFDVSKIYNELEDVTELKDRIIRFGKIFTQSEGLKQFTAPFFMANNNRIHEFKYAIIYQELIQILTFVEFFNPLKNIFKSNTELNKLAIAFSTIRMNKIRNSIAHYDWVMDGDNINFLDEKFSYSVKYVEVSMLASLFSLIGLFLVNDVTNL